MSNAAAAAAPTAIMRCRAKRIMVRTQFSALAKIGSRQRSASTSCPPTAAQLTSSTTCAACRNRWIRRHQREPNDTTVGVRSVADNSGHLDGRTRPRQRWIQRARSQSPIRQRGTDAPRSTPLAPLAGSSQVSLADYPASGFLAIRHLSGRPVCQIAAMPSRSRSLPTLLCRSRCSSQTLPPPPDGRKDRPHLQVA